MYQFDVKCTSDMKTWVFIHPVFPQFGLAIDKRDDQVQVHLVRGEIDGESRLERVTDHSAPVEVQVWFFLALSQIQSYANSVNTESVVDLSTLMTTTIVEYL